MELLPWLTAIGRVQDAAMLSALIIFMITPKAGRKNFRVIGIILMVGFLTDMCSWAAFHINPNPAGFFYGLFLIPAFFFFYKPKIDSKKIINVFLVLAISYETYSIINTFFIQGINALDSYRMAAQCVVLAIYATVYFRVLAKELPRQVYIHLPVFWINCAVLIYYMALLPIYLVTDYVYITLKISIIPLWMVHNTFGIIYYIFLSIGLWRNRELYTRQSSLNP